MNSLTRPRETLKKLIAPPSNLSLDAWAEKYAYLSQEESYESGKYHLDRAPYQAEPQKVYSDPSTRVLVLMWGSQTGKTQIIKNVIAYHIHQDPLPMLLVQPDLKMAESFSKDRIDPMIRDTPALHGLVTENLTRTKGNTILHKKFVGGHITMSGANSPASLASRPIAIFLGDEVDRWPESAGKEGDPGKLAEMRTKTFDNSKIVYTSSPTFQGASAIERAFELTDKRYLFVPCPKCGHTEILVWENLKYDSETLRDKERVLKKSIRYVFGCGHDIGESQKYKAITDAFWKPTAEPVFPGHVGFHNWSGNSLVFKWDALINEYLDAKKVPEKLKVFWNTKLSRLWQEKGESPEWESVMAKREFYPRRIIPDGGIMLVAGMDVQVDRAEVEIKAYGKRLENWSVDYRVLIGNPLTVEFWSQVDDLMNEDFQYSFGIKTKIHRLGIDSGNGNHTTIIYQYVRKWSQNPAQARVVALKGSSQKFAPIVATPKLLDKFPDGSPMPGGVYLYLVGTDNSKSEIYQSLRQPVGRDGKPTFHKMHFPDYDEKYFQQLTAESLTAIRTRSGQTKYFYALKPGHRAEVLDCNVYCRAVVASFGCDTWTDTGTDSHWDQFLTQYIKREPFKPVTEKTQGSQKPAQQPQIKKKSHVISRGISDQY